MFKLLSPLAIAGALLSLSCLGAAPARALSLATFVSGKGIDTGTCVLANPCRTFQFAIGQTSPGGAVKVLDVANYGAMVLTQSISIEGIDGAGINRPAGDAITINAGPNDVVNLTHLTVDGIKTGSNGIVLNTGGSLTIAHCVVRNFVGFGIFLQPTGALKFLIGDTLVSDNFDNGIVVSPQKTGSAQGTLDHVSMNKNFNGITVIGSSTTGTPNEVTAVDSRATNNKENGFLGGDGAVLRLAHSVATGNSNAGVAIGNPTVESFGDNYIRGNRIDVQGTLTHVATQ